MDFNPQCACAPKRIFFVYYNLGFGGVQTRIINLANRLAAQGVECWIFLKENVGDSRAHLVDKRIHVVIFPRLKLRTRHVVNEHVFALIISLLTLFLKPHAVFVSMHPLSSHLVLFLSFFHPRLAQKVVISEDTFPSLEIIYDHTSQSRETMRSLYSKAKHVFVASQSTYNDLKTNYKISSPPLAFVPNGIHFQHTSTPTGEGRDIDIVYGGRLTEQKRPLVAVEVFLKIVETTPGVIIHVYGDGYLREEFLKAITTRGLLPSVRYFSPTDDLGGVLRRSKILVCTSLYEGLSITGMEAMKHGAVNACLDAPGSRDLVIRNKTGLLERSVASLAARVVAVLRNPALLATLRRNAYVYGKEHFSEANERTLVDMLLR